MADRYWVGGSGSWNSTTKWSATSGGASGASVPTSADNAIFNASSGSGAVHYTVTVTANSTCANLTFTPVAADGATTFNVDTGFVIAGTFSTSGTQGNRRAAFRSLTYGLTRDMSIATIGTVTDVDFRDIRVTGAGGTLTGTRIGDLKGNVNITFSTPKTVYWVTLAGGNWSGNNWAASSGGAANTGNFPLAQDTATIENTGLNTSATVTVDTAMASGSLQMSGITMSTRTNAMTLATGTVSPLIYGSWTNGSGTTLTGTGTFTFVGRTTQTITSAGKTFTQVFVVDTYGGSVELNGDLNIGANTLTVTNGTFDTKSFNVIAGAISSTNPNVRTITLGASTVTLSGSSPVVFTQSINLTFNAGTSQINCSSSAAALTPGGMTFYNVSLTSNAISTASILSPIGGSTFNNITITPPFGTGVSVILFNDVANDKINGTLTVAGASPVRRIFVRSDNLGVAATLTVGTLSATDCDFRDITIAGTAAGSSPTRAGDCGGNSGITFPAAKTVYWNLAGAQNWSATAWAPGSGGSPDINNFPLAQDTAVFDEAAGSVTGTITINAAWNIGTFDASLRTSAMTLTTSTNTPFVYGDWKFGTGVTSSSTAGTITFAKRGTQTITSNGITFGCPVTIDSVTGVVQLADALSLDSTRTLTLTSGTFDAVSYNVTTGLFSAVLATSGSRLKMGSGTWTLSGTGSVWTGISSDVTFYKGTADIVLSNTSASARTFTGGGLSYNKLTIGGATGISTLTISGNNQFTELASTKTVAHTIALGTTTQTFGKWTVTGTVGNVVTLTGTGTAHVLAGACTSGIDYLAMGSIGFAATSPGEFYAGANSTGTAAAPVYRTAKPADSTRYWVGGTGNWSDTARWSTSSGGASGASVPRSHDDVVFDSLSNATAYTATVDAVTGGIRCKALTIAGPLVGNVTLAGSTAIVGIHGNVTLPATGLTRTYTGAITLSGSTSGLTLTTNGVVFVSPFITNGVASEWSLGSAAECTTFSIVNGSFDLAGYNLTCQQIASDNGNSRTINFGSGTTTATIGTTTFGTTETSAANLTVIAGTSQLNFSNANPTFSGNGKTFYNVAFTSTSAGTVTINGANSFNNLSFTGITSAGLKVISVTANQTITGTFTCSAGANATMRHFVRSDTLGTTRTLTCAAVSLTDVDFRDITIAGAAAPATGTRIGDCKGNSGITFTAAANKYWNLAAGGNWGGAIGWATGSGGTPAINNFPLAQDTCFFEATGLNSGATVTINQSYNIGTIDMSARTTNTMTLSNSSNNISIYGNWINGTGTGITGSGSLNFVGRTTQTITSAGKTFTQNNFIESPSGSVTLQDAYTSSSNGANAISLTSGTFDANGYNVTFTNGGGVTVSGILTKSIAVGSGTWLVSGITAWNLSGPTNTTVTGTGTISLTSASAKTFAGGGVSYSGITLNQGGAGTLTISGNNTFKTISSTAAGANTINIGTTTQRITTSWTASGTAGNILTVQGTSASSPGTLVFTGGGQAANVDYLAITGVRAYNLDSTWYAGANSTNNGSLGWIFAAPGGTTFNVSFSDTATGSDAVSASFAFNVSFSDTATASDTILGGLLYSCDFSDTVTASDSIAGSLIYTSDIFESATGSDALSAASIFPVAFSDTATGSDALSAQMVFATAVSELATGADALSALVIFVSSVSETASVLDTPSVAASIFNVSLSELASGLDAVDAAGSIFNVSLSETGAITDVVVGGYLWNPIDDSQSPNWQNVQNAQAPGWVEVNSTQSPGWVQIQT